MPPNHNLWKSHALWPKGTIPGTDISFDTHDTGPAAAGICYMLMKEGFGGDGKIFPICTWVTNETHPSKKIMVSGDFPVDKGQPT